MFILPYMYLNNIHMHSKMLYDRYGKAYANIIINDQNKERGVKIFRTRRFNGRRKECQYRTQKSGMSQEEMVRSSKLID